MEALGRLADGKAASAALRALGVRYREWTLGERAKIAELRGRRRETAEELLRLCEVAATRIEAGIATLEAFRVSNRAVARALGKRLRIKEATSSHDDPPNYDLSELQQRAEPPR